ncbi:MAG: hypothetical protein CMG23_06785 [Candidatus Marinimicrobia bacterium]|nr:hypothetical protein [Candidatus Neomarinimicrobiota bacterium]
MYEYDYIHLISLLMLSHIVGENFSQSSFPGGYLSIGPQIGKTQEKTRYIDIQISPSIVLIGPYKQDL